MTRIQHDNLLRKILEEIENTGFADNLLINWEMELEDDD